MEASRMYDGLAGLLSINGIRVGVSALGGVGRR